VQTVGVGAGAKICASVGIAVGGASVGVAVGAVGVALGAGVMVGAAVGGASGGRGAAGAGEPRPSNANTATPTTRPVIRNAASRSQRRTTGAAVSSTAGAGIKSASERPVPTVGGYLIPSATTAGQVYRISDRAGCCCEAAVNGAICWHSALVEILTAATDQAEPLYA
jgi:hypothetical protein